MQLKIGRRSWVIFTTFIIVFTAFSVGRNLLHAYKIKRQITALERERDYYRTKVTQDSTLLENLRYDDYLEQYAREHYHMQKRDERVFIIQE